MCDQGRQPCGQVRNSNHEVDMRRQMTEVVGRDPNEEVRLVFVKTFTKYTV